MIRPKKTSTGHGWFKVLFVTLLVLAAALVWIAQPAMAEPKTFEVRAKGMDKKTKTFRIKYDPSTQKFSSATKDGVALQGEHELQFPVKSTNILALDSAGPFLVIGDNTCVCVPSGGGLRCIGSPCP
jgi:hypothetical protein